MQTYLFYDIETTGLNECFDQILHFAAIRTDMNLNELERYELKIKLNPDVIPTPRAMITHRMDFSEIFTGISEYDAIQQIHQWMNEPGTISLGYNTLGFDDIFLRFAFYRYLLPPYTHQFKNNCGRLDIFPMAIMYFLFKKSILTWPEINGKVSFKLEELNAANHFIEGRSHHAMVDVEITLALARRLWQDQEMWNYLVHYFNKGADEKRLSHLKKAPVILVKSKLGADQDFQCPALFIGQRHHYRQSLWLQLDAPTLSQTHSDNIQEMKYILHKKNGEPPFILPERFLQHLKPERLARMEENKKWLAAHPDIYEKIVNYQTDYRYPTYPDVDVQASLYLNDFWSYEEEAICRTFHAATPKEKSKLIEKIKNPVLHALAIRMVARHFPDELSPQQKELFVNYLIKKTVIDYQGKPRLMMNMALQEIIELRKQSWLDAQQLDILIALEEYLNNSQSLYKFVVS